MGEVAAAEGTPVDVRTLADSVEAVIGPAYMVGGSVRDALMGRPSTDYDFATPLGPDEIEARIRAAGRRPYLVGKRFGTIGFVASGVHVEITTFRSETFPAGSRGPRVMFLDDLEQDLAHRDFTIDAIAMRGDEVIDPHGGVSDIQGRLIKAVGSAKTRFEEDPLRMLRAARLMAQLDFQVDTRSVDAARRLARRILSVSRERWVTELDKLLVGPGAVGALRLLADTRLLAFMIPELQLQVGYDQNSRWHDRTLFEHTLGVVAATEPELEMRWAALLHDIGKPYARIEKPGRSVYVHHELIGAEMVERIALYLRWSTERRRNVRALVRGHMLPESPMRPADDSAKGPAVESDPQ